MENTTYDLISTSYQKGKLYFNNRIKSGNIPICSAGYVKGSCKGGHQFASIQFCGKEYCPDCSKDGSPIHQRRVAKWSEKTKDYGNMGYLVVTIPDYIRPFMFSRFILRDFRQKLLRKLKEDYKIDKGLCRYHWFGDCANCSGSGCLSCNDTGSGDFWHPHLNILFESGYIKDVEQWLLPLKKWISQYLKKMMMVQIDSCTRFLKYDFDGEILVQMDDLINRKNQISPESLVVDYSYVNTDAKKMNRIKYVTRSTFRIYNVDVKKELYNFRNSVVFGWKKGEVQESFDDTSQNCPICEQNGIMHQIKWNILQKIKPNTYIKNEKSTGTGRNYIRIITGTDADNTNGSGYVPLLHNRSAKKIQWNKVISNNI
tara:strand:- start:247 stop:1359 length:1113 start_codon:yes stop_codon:yes gene_type:complete